MRPEPDSSYKQLEELRRSSISSKKNTRKGGLQLKKIGWLEAKRLAIGFFITFGIITALTTKHLDLSSYIGAGLGGATGIVLVVWLVNCFVKARDKNKSSPNFKNAMNTNIDNAKTENSIGSMQTIEGIGCSISELVHSLNKEDKYREVSNTLQHRAVAIQIGEIILMIRVQENA